MGLIFRSKNTPESLFREAVDAAISNVLEKGGFGSMEEILERGKTDKPYKKTPRESADELLKSYGYDGDYSDEGIDKMFGESWVIWVKGKNEVHNYVWQRAYLEIFTSISKSNEFSETMKKFSNQIAYEYGISVWNTIFDEYQRFFIMLWRMNTSYSSINPRQKRLISLIKGFYKSMNKASRNLGKEFEKVDLDHSNVYVLENFFEVLLKKFKQDKTALSQMLKISNYFAEDFGKMLWYGRFSELQKFVLVCSEACRVWQILKQYS